MNHAVNWEAVSAIGQIVGALAVAISLIYVAREVRSSAHATREASMRSVSESYTRWIQQLSAHPELRELYYRGIHDFNSLEGADLVGFSVLMLEAFRPNAEIYHQRSQGLFGPRLSRGFEVSFLELKAYPGVQAWWRSRSHWFREEFANYINQIQRTDKAPRLYREPMTDE